MALGQPLGDEFWALGIVCLIKCLGRPEALGQVLPFWSDSLCYGEGDGTPLQYSCLENPMDGGAWWAAVPGVSKSWTRLSDFTFTFHFHALEKEMATHSSVLAWRIPRTGEPGGLLSMGSHRHDWSDLAAAAAAYVNNGVCGGCLFSSGGYSLGGWGQP